MVGIHYRVYTHPYTPGYTTIFRCTRSGYLVSGCSAACGAAEPWAQSGLLPVGSGPFARSGAQKRDASYVLRARITRVRARNRMKDWIAPGPLRLKPTLRGSEAGTQCSTPRTGFLWVPLVKATLSGTRARSEGDLRGADPLRHPSE